MNKIIRRISQIKNEPTMLFYYIQSKFIPKHLLSDYSNKNVLLDRLYFVLSFDCDTVEDIEVVESLNEELSKIGVKAVYAVPGELLKKGKKQYRSLLSGGAEFINHGYLTHSIKVENEYINTLDYAKISLDEVKVDILRGDESIKELLGVTPKGFRTPHFGSFQKRIQLLYQHKILKELGYRYSTSTTPYFSLRYGAVFDDFGIYEIPMTGLASELLRVFDSFLFFDQGDGYFNGENYGAAGVKISEMYQENVTKGIINIYVDPSQVYGCKSAFLNTIEQISRNALSVTYSELLEHIS